MLPCFDDARKQVWIAEDEPEKFFRRPVIEIDDSEILRWEIAVEALCELTGERPVFSTLPRATAEDEE